MSYTFCGIALNKNVKENIAIFELLLDKKLDLIEEIIFEEAMNFDKGGNFCDIYFSENGTLVFFSDFIEESFLKKSTALKIAKFSSSEVSMQFDLEICENQKYIRRFQEDCGVKLLDDGVRLIEEDEYDDGFEIVTKSISELIGENFWNIDLSSEAFRFEINTLDELSMIRYFKFQDEKSNKFWKIQVNGEEQIVWFGRVGTNGQTISKVYETSELCKTESLKLINEKQKKGYIESFHSSR